MTARNFLIMIVILVAVAGGLLFARKEETIQTPLESQINSEGSVEVEVTPLSVSHTSDRWEFSIVISTHSVELDQDLTEVSVLIDEGGNEYESLTWEGSPPGGHHREGVLSFKPISPMPGKITLRLKGIGTIAERNFVWELGR
ncbi:MAG: hypothetical protein NUV98_01950 [Candidatus Roizmanbacteria bacterium]|nr:hypothetical protein [Candidatus Roizmanbacteria bacterium]